MAGFPASVPDADIYAGDTFEWPAFRFLSGGDPVDLTVWTGWAATWRPTPGSPDSVDLDVDTTDGATGTVKVSADAQVAAKRGFIRTTAQAYGTALAGGISTTVILGVVTGEVQLVPTLVTIGVAVVSPVIAGAASYFSILSRGIPSDYAPAE